MKSLQQLLNNNALALQQLLPIYQEVAQRMQQHLHLLKFTPNTILDLGARFNIDRQLLQERYQNSQIYSLDIALNMLKSYYNTTAKVEVKNIFKQLWQSITNMRYNCDLTICADYTNLPIKTASIDLLWSNLILPHLCYHYQQADNITTLKEYFAEIKRVLKVGGAFLVAGLSQDSFKELRHLGFTTYQLPDMHLIGDILVQQGFSDVVTDTEHITLQYSALAKALSEIRLIGNANAYRQSAFLHRKADLIDNNSNRFKQLLPSDALSKSLLPAYLAQQQQTTITLEVFYAHGWRQVTANHLTSEYQTIKFHRFLPSTSP